MLLSRSPARSFLQVLKREVTFSAAEKPRYLSAFMDTKAHLVFFHAAAYIKCNVYTPHCHSVKMMPRRKGESIGCSVEKTGKEAASAATKDTSAVAEVTGRSQPPPGRLRSEPVQTARAVAEAAAAAASKAAEEAEEAMARAAWAAAALGTAVCVVGTVLWIQQRQWRH